MLIHHENIPQELKARSQWVCWQTEYRDGKPTKVPYQTRDGRGSSTDAATWTTFEDAWQAYERRTGFDGVGFVLADDDPFVGIDLDHCIDDDGEFSAEATQIVQRLYSYAEVTPSGKGLHIWVKGQLPPSGRKRGNFEVYDQGRFFTMTGAHLEGTPQTIEERTQALTKLHAEFFPLKKGPANPVDHAPVDLDDQAIIEKAMSAKNGASFTALWHGNWSAYSSQSEADLTLCDKLAFWTGGDAGRMDSLFQQSGLYRDKWDEKHGAQTYGEMTIRKALEGATEFYSSDGSHNIGASRPEHLTSDYKGMLSEVRLKRVSAATLQKRALSGGLPPISKLPFLGQSEISPFISGWAHLFYGYPKTGKTELLTRTVNEWGKQGHGVLFLTEEPEMVWGARLAGLPSGFENVSLVFALGAPVKDMYDEIVDGPEDIVVVDTLRLLRLADENDNSGINISLTPFIAACRLSKKTLVSMGKLPLVVMLSWGLWM